MKLIVRRSARRQTQVQDYEGFWQKIAWQLNLRAIIKRTN